MSDEHRTRQVQNPADWVPVPSTGANATSARELRALAEARGYHDHAMLAAAARLPAGVVRAVLRGDAPLTDDLAARLAAVLGTTSERLMGAQHRSNVESVREARLRDLEPEDAAPQRIYRGPRR